MYPRLQPYVVQVDVKLGSGAHEAGWVIQEAYLGGRKAGNWRYVSPRGLSYKTITAAAAERAAGGDLVPRVRLVMSRGGAVLGAPADGNGAEGGDQGGGQGGGQGDGQEGGREGGRESPSPADDAPPAAAAPAPEAAAQSGLS